MLFIQFLQSVGSSISNYKSLSICLKRNKWTSNKKLQALEDKLSDLVVDVTLWAIYLQAE